MIERYLLFLIISICVHHWEYGFGLVMPDLSMPCLNGVCVQTNVCKNNSVLLFGEGLLDIRISSNYDEARYCEAEEKCCSLGTELVNELTGHHVESVPHNGCGIRNYDPDQGHSHGEFAAQYAEFPWMVAVLLTRLAERDESISTQHPQSLTTLSARSHRTTPIKEHSPKSPQPPKFDFRCGGSLIHPNVVLTAAHCVDAIPHARLVVRAGEWDTRRTDERWPHENRDVQHAEVHPHYYSRAVHNDIALLFLTESVRLVEHINTICLPPPQHRFPSSSRCLVSGWGKNNFGRAGRFQSILKRVELPVVERATCQLALRQTKLGRHFRLHHSFICAGGEAGSDMCKGDGGSPLVCPAITKQHERVVAASNEHDFDVSKKKKKKEWQRFMSGGDVEFRRTYYQAGIVSWGVGCNEQVPAAYVNVAAFRTWIDGEMERRGLDTGFYTHASK